MDGERVKGRKWEEINGGEGRKERRGSEGERREGRKDIGRNIKGEENVYSSLFM